MADQLVGKVNQIHRDLERYKSKRVSFHEQPLPDYKNGQLGFSPDSKIDESDQASSIIPIRCLGLLSYRNMYPNEPIPGICMDLAQLRRHLDLPESRDATIRGSVRESMINEKLEQKWHSEAVAILPLGAFERIFTAGVVRSVLRELYPKTNDGELDALLYKVLGPDRRRERRRILAILIYMEAIDQLNYFFKNNIYDQDLPINSPSDKEYCKVEMEHLSSWKENERILFTSYQKMVFVPVFHIKSDELCSYSFSAHARLPWLSYESKSKGGFGVVFKVQIHPSHSTPLGTKADSGAGQYFALKKIGSKNSKHYRDELAALEKSSIQAGREKHLIKLLLTYTHGKKNYFLFEWADMNLAEFWRKNPPDPSPEGVTWVAHQCLGIAKAIRRIHGLTTMQIQKRSGGSQADDSSNDDRDSGRHGDIKPDNILWFSKYGEESNILVVSDLGLTRYHSIHSVSHVRNSQIDGFSWTYKAPEHEMGHETSQKYDVWSLGCVFLEFWVWHFGGSNAQKEFEGERTDEDDSGIEGLQIDKFWGRCPEVGGAVVKPSIRKWIQWMCTRQDCTDFARRMLEIIEKGMLVVDVKARWKIDAVYRAIFDAVKELLPAVPSCVEQPSLTDDQSMFPEASQLSTQMSAAELSVGQIVRDAEGDSSLHPPEVAASTSRQSSISLCSRTDLVDGLDPKESQLSCMTSKPPCPPHQSYYKPEQELGTREVRKHGPRTWLRRISRKISSLRHRSIVVASKSHEKG